jgi:GTP cyclohydrolase I
LGEPRLGVAELARPMKIFRHHLLSLLGVADALDTPEQRTLALDAIVRRRIVENSLEAINSIQVIVNLITDQTNMRVSKQVQNQVKGSLASLKHVRQIQSTFRQNACLLKSRHIVTLLTCYFCSLRSHHLFQLAKKI